MLIVMSALYFSFKIFISLNLQITLKSKRKKGANNILLGRIDQKNSNKVSAGELKANVKVEIGIRI